MTTSLFNDSDFKNSYKSKPRCHTTHKPLKLGKGEVLGGACGAPRSGYDIYIGFDYGMQYNHSAFPWEDDDDDAVVEVLFKITDMCAPRSPKQFKKMIEWCALRLDAGKNIHVGCIGGHGRTGLFLAALVAFMGASDDPIGYVREHHCKKAVESDSQLKFLNKHFGIKIKGHSPTKGDWKQSTKFDNHQGTTTGRFTSKYWKRQGNATPIERKKGPEKLKAMTGKGSIWG